MPTAREGFEAGKRFFEEQLAAAFREMARVLKPGGIAVVATPTNRPQDGRR